MRMSRTDKNWYSWAVASGEDPINLNTDSSAWPGALAFLKCLISCVALLQLVLFNSFWLLNNTIRNSINFHPVTPLRTLSTISRQSRLILSHTQVKSLPVYPLPKVNYCMKLTLSRELAHLTISRLSCLTCSLTQYTSGFIKRKKGKKSFFVGCLKQPSRIFKLKKKM